MSKCPTFLFGDLQLRDGGQNLVILRCGRGINLLWTVAAWLNDRYQSAVAAWLIDRH